LTIAETELLLLIVHRSKYDIYNFFIDKTMVDDNDDVPLLRDDDDEHLITSEDRQPNVEAVFVVTFDIKYGKN
jgi:hypothetical protein